MATASEIAKDLFYQPKHGYDLMDREELDAMNTYCENYKIFLNDNRIERECVKTAIELAESKGFQPYEPGMPLHPGSKLYFNNRDKSLFLVVMGEKPLSEGAVIAGAHVDAPRLDLKPQPVMETDELSYFRTHYYGGIRKYQWLTIPLELHGVVVLADGEKVDVCIGRNPEDPKFIITDLLPHLAAKQNEKKLSEAHTGEGLKLLIGSVPYDCEGDNRVKLAVMSILNSIYGITEEDFLSAELEVVPGMDVCDIGLDRSMIGGYGHDDRSCAYAELAAILSVENPPRTAICLLADKEEIGSDGVTGMQSATFDHFMEDLCAEQNVELRHCYENSFCLSADVCNAFDPLYPEVSEKQNSALFNHGVGICKYTGSRGKGGTNDAAAETVGYIRKVFAENGVSWQMAELGKVDEGGGGTIAKFMGNRGIVTIDAGVPVMSMHSPMELVAKFDCYMTFKACASLYNAE